MIGFLRNLVTRDLGLKLFALALAVLIWATVQFAIQRGITGNLEAANQIFHTFPNLPVIKMSAAADPRVFGIQPPEVEVTVRGDPRLMERLTARDIRVTVDLTELGDARALRKHVDVATPPGVTLVRVTPEYVNVIVPNP